jgi:hypothetical protein
MNEEDNSWYPSKEVFDAATELDLEFIFEQASKRVDATAKEGDDLYSKSIGIVSICLPALSAIVGYLISNFKFSPVTFISIPVALILIVVLSKMKRTIVIGKIKYRGVGTYPSQLAVKEFYEKLNGKSSKWYLLWDQIIKYQQRIDLNVKNNNDRKDRINRCYGWLYSIPYVIIASTVIYLISYLAISS